MNSVIKLSFGQVLLLGKSLAEVVIDEGVEVNKRMIHNLHLALATHLKAPFRVLLNKENSYSFSYEAQRAFGNMSQFQSIAMLAKTSSGELSAKVKSQVSESCAEFGIFKSRSLALNWLQRDYPYTGTAIAS
ncbi:hypothetical protein QP938_00135 [Porticoccaceae bacterium LTM1]|nr:hypothetical protein QP938_00135 [Porticoccaceae bacterium LTM1]